MSLILCAGTVRDDELVPMAQPKMRRFGDHSCATSSDDGQALVFSTANGRRVLEALGYYGQTQSMCVNELGALASQWLKRHIGRIEEGFCCEEGPLDGQRDGFLNQEVLKIAKMAREAKAGGLPYIIRYDMEKWPVAA